MPLHLQHDRVLSYQECVLMHTANGQNLHA